MTSNRRTSANPEILVPPGNSVKAKIIAAGLKLGQLAARARISPSTLSDYLAGRIRNVHGQFRIHRAFCNLTGGELTAREFWGKLLAKEAA